MTMVMNIILTHQIQFKKICNQILVPQDNHDNDIKILEQDLLASAVPQIILLDLMSLSTAFPCPGAEEKPFGNISWKSNANN